MDANSILLGQLIVAAIGVAAVIAYVIYTIKLYRSYERNLKELQKANTKHEDEFRISTRPWVGYEDIEASLSEITSSLEMTFYFKNYGLSPAMKTQIDSYISDRPDKFISHNLVTRSIAILPNDRKKVIYAGDCNWVNKKSKSPAYLLFLVTYESAFGKHWSKLLVRVEVGKDIIYTEAFETGDSESPKVEVTQRIPI